MFEEVADDDCPARASAVSISFGVKFFDRKKAILLSIGEPDTPGS